MNTQEEIIILDLYTMPWIKIIQDWLSSQGPENINTEETWDKSFRVWSNVIILGDDPQSTVSKMNKQTNGIASTHEASVKK